VSEVRVFCPQKQLGVVELCPYRSMPASRFRNSQAMAALIVTRIQGAEA
jgi:hypothetical protein